MSQDGQKWATILHYKDQWWYRCHKKIKHHLQLYLFRSDFFWTAACCKHSAALCLGFRTSYFLNVFQLPFFAHYLGIAFYKLRTPCVVFFAPFLNDLFVVKLASIFGLFGFPYAMSVYYFFNGDHFGWFIPAYFDLLYSYNPISLNPLSKTLFQDGSIEF